MSTRTSPFPAGAGLSALEPERIECHCAEAITSMSSMSCMRCGNWLTPAAVRKARKEWLDAALFPADVTPEPPAASQPSDEQVDDALEAWFASGPAGIDQQADRIRMRGALAAVQGKK